MGDGEEFIADEIGLVKCPKCKNDMVELIQEDMTEGQQADYDAGFNHPYECPECGYYDLFNVPSIYEREDSGWEDEEIDELVEITRIDPSSFEEVIENALRSKCFVEAISLIHNVIEAYLKTKIEGYLSADEMRLKLLKEKFKPQYLKDYNTICYILGLIKSEDYKRLIEFNKNRNKIIHELLKKSMTIIELRKITRNGRELQIKLSPLNHSEAGIKRIMDEFDRLIV
jgi:hypothetical protein